MPRYDPKNYLWRNISALMRSPNPSLGAVKRKVNLGMGTLQRIREGSTSVGVDTLYEIAQAFHVEVWQLLVPDLDPDDLPALHPKSPAAWPFTEELLAATMEADPAIRRVAENAARVCLDLDPLPREAKVRLA